ncbi:MAG: hypothetical protein DRJ01_00140 [Bacteroidetes bacterium]|nr:MAG: hypothetical protein DRJ01_00140 [Bacteroidota bacterium]
MYIYRYKILLLLTFVFIFSKVNSQNIGFDSLKLQEDTLRVYFDSLAKQKDDSLKFKLNNKIIETFQQVFSNKESFEYVFNIRHIGILKAPDNSFKIYNWNISLNDGSYKYFGFIQYFHKKSKQFLIYQLCDKSEEIINPQTMQLSNKNWFGALYYEIILKKSDKNKYYTLLAWDGNNDFSKKKIIDVLYFTKTGEPRFGKNIFIFNKEKKSRVIYEYSYLSTMTLRYNDKLNMIIADHLEPSKPSLKGQFQYYGPDFTYDGFFYKNGKWIYKQHIDVRNPSKN